MRLSAFLYHAKRSVVNVICFSIDKVFSVFKSRPDTHYQSLKKVLVIRLDAIGDFIVWTDSARAYRQLYPPEEYKLVLLGNESWCALAAEMQLFDEIWPIHRKNFIFNPFYRLKILKQLSAYTFESVIYPTYSREFSTGDLLMRWLNASRKIGLRSDTAIDAAFWTDLSLPWYTHLYTIPSEKPHELHKNAAFIRTMGLENFQPSRPFISIPFHDAENIKVPECFYILFPGARIPLRQWDFRNYAQLAENIYAKTGWKGIICGSAHERALAEKIITMTHVPLENLAGRTTLKQLISIIASAKLLIGNETSGVHIAVAVNTPSLCLLGGGHFGRFVPYPDDLISSRHDVKTSAPSLTAFYPMPCFNCDWNCIYRISKISVVPCIEHITVVAAWKETSKLLNLI